MGRSKTYLVAIALALGLTGAQAQPAPHESLGPKGILTAERQKLLATVVAARGKKANIAPLIAAALGLPYGEVILQIAAKPAAIHHVYEPLPEGGILLALVDTVSARNYRLDAHLKLVVAVTAVDNIPTAIPIAGAQGTVDEELKFWADIADQLADAPEYRK